MTKYYKDMVIGSQEEKQRYIKLLRAKLNKAKRENVNPQGIKRLQTKLERLTK